MSSKPKVHRLPGQSPRLQLIQTAKNSLGVGFMLVVYSLVLNGYGKNEGLLSPTLAHAAVVAPEKTVSTDAETIVFNSDTGTIVGRLTKIPDSTAANAAVITERSAASDSHSDRDLLSILDKH